MCTNHLCAHLRGLADLRDGVSALPFVEKEGQETTLISASLLKGADEEMKRVEGIDGNLGESGRVN